MKIVNLQWFNTLEVRTFIWFFSQRMFISERIPKVVASIFPLQGWAIFKRLSVEQNKIVWTKILYNKFFNINWITRRKYERTIDFCISRRVKMLWDVRIETRDIIQIRTAKRLFLIHQAKICHLKIKNDSCILSTLVGLKFKNLFLWLLFVDTIVNLLEIACYF